MDVTFSLVKYLLTEKIKKLFRSLRFNQIPTYLFYGQKENMWFKKGKYWYKKLVQKIIIFGVNKCKNFGVK